MSDEPGYIIEQGRRLSESILWQLQRDLYHLHGIQAWSHGNVPQSITTSPYIARAYAKLALGYLRDVTPELDLSQPVYIIELGAGSGRFGYRFVKRFTSLLERSSLAQTKFMYVMTDVTSNLVDYWQAHPKLRPLVETGVLDFAQVDATRLADIALLNSGKTLQGGAVANPVIVVANYVFDSIPHDYFSIQDHELFENLVTVTSARPDLAVVKQSLTDLQVSFEPHPVQPDYYAEAELNRVLERYRQRLGNVMLMVPVAGMACLRYFRELSRNRALFLIGDIGFAREADVREHASGGIGAESNFWLEVNFHAIGEYVGELGGRALHPPYRHAGLNISAFILGSSSTDFCETALAYDDAIGLYGPDDFFITSRIIGKQYQEMSRGELLAFVRSTGWDSDHFLNCMPYLLDSLQEISWTGREDLRRGVEEAWDAYYPMGADAGDLAFGFGVLLYTIGDYAEALEYFQRSLELFGEDPKTTFNIALCLHRLKRMPEVVKWLDRTLQLDPDSEQAVAMRAKLMEG